jgi:exocyst complex component 4
LDTIRLDLRCRTIHHLDSSMQNVSNQPSQRVNPEITPFQGTYDSNYEPIEPDPYIVDLTTELVQCDESMAIHLPKKEREYVQLQSNFEIC